jgi:glucosamine--fructose-6-phosphate aminotransferase (isomerizing)
MQGSRSPVQNSHTLPEILSQPDVWRSCLRDLSCNPVLDYLYLRSGRGLQTILSKSPSRKEWLFVGCGTSFYLAEAAAGCWTLLSGQPARALPASELLLFPGLGQLKAQDLQAVVISRSGRTSEAVRVAGLLSQKYNLPTLGVTCAVNSELAKACELTLVLPAADETSMVMTRSFTSMLLALIHVAASHADAQALSSSFETVAAALASRIGEFNDGVESFVSKHSFSDYIYLAQGPFVSIAREAALKITEMSCSYAQAYHTLEFRHGPKSIVGPETCLTFFLSESGMNAEIDVLVEMKELGGTIVTVCNRASEAVRRSSDLLIELETGAPELAFLAPFIVPAQLLGFHTGIKKGLNPDEPKNLGRVVILN